MSRKPKHVIGVVIRRGMLCVGCPIVIFHMVPEACKEHRVAEGLFLRELAALIGAGRRLFAATANDHNAGSTSLSQSIKEVLRAGSEAGSISGHTFWSI